MHVCNVIRNDVVNIVTCVKWQIGEVEKFSVECGTNSEQTDYELEPISDNKMPCYRKDDRAMRPGALKKFVTPWLRPQLNFPTF